MTDNDAELQRRNAAFASLSAIITWEVKNEGRYERAMADLRELERLLPVESFLDGRHR